MRLPECIPCHEDKISPVTSQTVNELIAQMAKIPNSFRNDGLILFIRGACKARNFGKFGFYCFRGFPRPAAAHSDISQG